MQYIRKTTLGLAASLLFTLLLTFGVAFGLQRVLSTPDTIKSALKDSGFYQNAVGNALDQVQKGQGQPQGETQIPLDRPEVRNLIQSAASPEVLQTQVEQALDSVYAWLQGKSPTLAFNIEVGDIKTRLAAGLEEYTQEHLAALPPCSSGTAPSEDVDPFSATCMPQGISSAEVAAKAKDQILNGEFLKDTTITADNLKTGGGDKTIAQQLAAVPDIYRAVNWAVYGAGLLALLLAVAVLFLSRDRRSGLKKLSVIFIIVGVITSVLGWLAGYGVQRGAEYAKEPLQQSGVQAGQFLVNDLRTWWMGYGITLIVLAIVALVVLRFTRPSAEDEAKKLAGLDDKNAPDPAPAETHIPAPVDKPKPKPVKKLVQ